MDLPGFGESPPDEAGTALSVSDFADRIERFFAEQELERPHLAGNSLGGAIGLELGRRGAVGSLTAISPIGFWGRPGQAWCRGALRAGYKAGLRRPESIPPKLDLALLRLGTAVYSFGRPFQAPAEAVLATREAGLSAPGFLDACTHGLDYSFGDPGRLREIPLTIAWGRRDVLLPYWTQARGGPPPFAMGATPHAAGLRPRALSRRPAAARPGPDRRELLGLLSARWAGERRRAPVRGRPRGAAAPAGRPGAGARLADNQGARALQLRAARPCAAPWGGWDRCGGSESHRRRRALRRAAARRGSPTRRATSLPAPGSSARPARRRLARTPPPPGV